MGAAVAKSTVRYHSMMTATPHNLTVTRDYELYFQESKTKNNIVTEAKFAVFISC